MKCISLPHKIFSQPDVFTYMQNMRIIKKIFRGIYKITEKMFASYSRYFHVIVYHHHKKHSLIFIITNMMVTFFPSSWLIIDAVSCNSTYKHMHQCLHSHKFLFTFIYVIAKFTHLIKKKFVRWSYAKTRTHNQNYIERKMHQTSSSSTLHFTYCIAFILMLFFRETCLWNKFFVFVHFLQHQHTKNEKEKQKQPTGHDDGIFFIIWCLICKIYISEYMHNGQTGDFSDKNGWIYCTLYFFDVVHAVSCIYLCYTHTHTHTLLSISTINVEWGTYSLIWSRTGRSHIFVVFIRGFCFVSFLLHYIHTYTTKNIVLRLSFLLCQAHQLFFFFFQYRGQPFIPFVQNLYFCVFGHGVFRCATIVRGRSFVLYVILYLDKISKMGTRTLCTTNNNKK